MTRLRLIFFGLALLLALSRGRAQTVVWLDGFETNAATRWVAAGGWQIGGPGIGPARAFAGKYCALTQNYPYNANTRIYCKNYLNGSNTIVVPDASLSPSLTFEEWYNFANALGYVEIYTASNGWQQISSTRLDANTAGAWVQTSIDLSAYAGQSVQFGFHFTSGGCCGNAEGWYVDNVSLTESVTTAPQLTVPDDQTILAGTELVVTNFATNTFLPNAIYTFRLNLAPAHAAINASNGVVTWPTSTSQFTSTNTFIVQVTDNSSPRLMTTNSFLVNVVNPWEPVLTVPDTQTIFAGQTATATSSAANDYFPDDTFTFTLLSPVLTNMDVSDIADGVLVWPTDITQPAGIFTNVIMVTDDDAPFYSATNSFLIIVSNPPPPTLTLPATQTLYAGQMLDVTVSANNDAFPSSVFTFTLLAAPDGVALDPDTGELTWTTATTNVPKVYTIAVAVADDHTPPLTNAGSFQVVVSPTPPPMLLVPGTQTNYAGQTLAMSVSATNVVLTGSQFTFSLPSPSTNVTITAAGALTWTNTGVVNGILIWTNNSVAPGTRIIYVTATDNNSPPLSVTNHFSLVFLPPVPPTLNVPTNQFISVGQTLVKMLSATNVFLPACRFTFALATVSTNVSVQTNGVLTWTNTAAPPGVFVIQPKVTDNSVPPISATNNFSVTVLPLPSQLVLTNAKAFNSAGLKFKFSVQTPWTNTAWRILTATNLNGGGTNWLPVFTNKSGGSLQVTDLLATNFLQRYYRAVFP